MKKYELDQALKHIPDDAEILMSVDGYGVEIAEVLDFTEGFFTKNTNNEVTFYDYTENSNAICFWPDINDPDDDGM
jgi:hypothetical protein